MLTMHYVTKVRDSLEFRREMAATVRALAAANKEVILLGDVPRYEKTPSACKYAKRDPLCQLTPDQVELQRGQYAPVLEALAAENGIPYIDLHAPLCSDQACAMIVQGRVVYRARGHLNVAGSRLVGQHIHERWREAVQRE